MANVRRNIEGASGEQELLVDMSDGTWARRVVSAPLGGDGLTPASAANPLPVAHNTTGIGHGIKTVATAGTDVVLAASTPAKWVIIQAQTDNTGIIAVGATGVDATVATGSGVALAAGESVTLLCDNLADIFIDSTVSGDGVRFTYGT